MPSAPSAKALVPFVSVADMMRLLHRIGIERALAELTDAVEAAFRRWPDFDKTPRLAAHSPGGVIELMPVSDGALYACKYVNGHPGNTVAGLQTVAAFGLLADVATGYPLLLAEMTLLTALRTAATSAMAARVLAPPNARTLAMIGTGAQAEFQVLALRGALGIEHVRLFDVDPRAIAKAAANLAGTGLRITLCSSAPDAVQGAQVITTCTADKRRAIVLSDNMVGAGVHLNAIGGDCPGKTELAPAILHRSRIFVEYEPQTREEGEIQLLPASHPVTELWRVLCGEATGRVDPRDITLFDSVGFAVEDFAALRWLRDRLAGTDCFQPIDMVADPDDPRDLFGMVLRAG